MAQETIEKVNVWLDGNVNQQSLFKSFSLQRER
jgi:hypothetical protein